MPGISSPFMRLFLSSRFQSQLSFRLKRFRVLSRRLNSSATRPPTQKPSASPSNKRRSRLGPFARLIKLYLLAQARRPYLTQLCTMSFIYCLGDCSAQTIGKDTYDPVRTVRNIIVGGAISIPSYQWFIYLGTKFNYASALLSIGTKVVVNQILYGPLFNVYFFAAHALLSGEGLTGTIDRVKDTVPSSLPRSFLYWPLVTAFSFAYFEPQSRSVVAGLFAVFWQTYLSWLNSRAEKDGINDNDTTMLVPATMSQ